MEKIKKAIAEHNPSYTIGTILEIIIETQTVTTEQAIQLLNSSKDLIDIEIERLNKILKSQ